MKLFVFEGKRDRKYFNSLQKEFFSRSKEEILCVYAGNIYSLYNIIGDYGESADIVRILKDRANQSDPVLAVENSSDISEIYLFFDYDIHHDDGKTVDDKNKMIKEMLEFFSDETDHGKLYLHYPMVESLKYTKEVVDEEYYSYSVPINEVEDFKQLSAGFTFYQHGLPLSKSFWLGLKEQNVSKANYIVNDKNQKPDDVEDITQVKIFDSHLNKYFANGCVAVLNALPIFIYDYFGK